MNITSKQKKIIIQKGNKYPYIEDFHYPEYKNLYSFFIGEYMYDVRIIKVIQFPSDPIARPYGLVMRRIDDFQSMFKTREVQYFEMLQVLNTILSDEYQNSTEPPKELLPKF